MDSTRRFGMTACERVAFGPPRLIEAPVEIKRPVFLPLLHRALRYPWNATAAAFSFYYRQKKLPVARRLAFSASQASFRF